MKNKPIKHYVLPMHIVLISVFFKDHYINHISKQNYSLLLQFLRDFTVA